jgi:hypothetical protein
MVAMFRLALAALLGLVVTTAAAGADDMPEGSSWKNRRGSVLTIATVDARGAFKGTYESKASGFACQGKFDAAGTVQKTSVILHVTFKNATQDCHMVAVWRGSVKGSRLSVRWDLAHTNTKTGRLRFYKGLDIFSRM